MGRTQKIRTYPAKFTNRPGDREAAEGALERNLLANKFIIFFTLQTSFSTTTFVTHNLQRTAILKLPKLALCPFPAIRTESPRGGHKYFSGK
jgi:hypothetical protein